MKEIFRVLYIGHTKRDTFDFCQLDVSQVLMFLKNTYSRRVGVNF